MENFKAYVLHYMYSHSQKTDFFLLLTWRVISSHYCSNSFLHIFIQLLLWDTLCIKCRRQYVADMQTVHITFQA